MSGCGYACSVAVIRWSRDRVQHHLRRIRKPRLSSLLFYVLISCLLFVGSLSSLSPLKSKDTSRINPSNEIIQRNQANPAQQANPAPRMWKEKKPAQLVVNPHNYHLMISNTRLCADVDEVEMLFLVMSSAAHFDRRQAIRSTWGQSDYLLNYKARLVFLLANPSDSQVQRKIVEEYRTHGDTIQEDFVESYMNLTLKTVMGIKWASNYCSKTSYVTKTDDDIFVNVPLLLLYLKELDGNRFFTGCIKQIKSFKPVNVNPDFSLPSAHPLFAAGAGYVFSGSLLKDLLEASLRTRIIPVEDVYITGHLAKAVNAHPPLHDNRFSCGEMVQHDCHMTKLFTGHKITPSRMHQLWKIFNPNNVVNPCE